VVDRMVIARRDNAGTLLDEVIDEVAAQRDDLLALGDAETPTVGVGEAVLRHKVRLHVNDEQRVVWADRSRRCGAQPGTEQLQVLLEEGRVV